MAKAHFTIEVDLPDGVTHEDFRFWAEHELRCAVGGTDADDPLRKLDRKSLFVMTTAFKRRATAPPEVRPVHRPQNYVVAEEFQSIPRVHRKGEVPVKVVRVNLDDVTNKPPHFLRGALASVLADKRSKK